MNHLSSVIRIIGRGTGICMILVDGPLFRLYFFPVLFVCSILWSSVTLRLLSTLIFFTVLLLYFLKPQRCRTVWAIVAWLVFVGSTFLPVDISFQNYPGPPRFVPLVMGLPTMETVLRATNGEVVLGGYVVTGFEPEWVWVW